MCIHTDFLYLFLSFPPTQASSAKTQLSVSEAGRIPHVCVQKQHRCSQGHRGRNMPAGLWTWSWEESCVPPSCQISLNCFASELQRSNWSCENPSADWLQASPPSSLPFSWRVLSATDFLATWRCCKKLFFNEEISICRIALDIWPISIASRPSLYVRSSQEAALVQAEGRFFFFFFTFRFTQSGFFLFYAQFLGNRKACLCRM